MTSPLKFVIDHLDSCPHCSVGDFCNTGRSLMVRGQQVAAALSTAIPDVMKPRVKA